MKSPPCHASTSCGAPLGADVPLSRFRRWSNRRWNNKRRLEAWIAYLAHEVGNHAVEGRALEVQGLPGPARALLACGQLSTRRCATSSADHFPPTTGNPTSRAPVQSARKFSAVLGTTSFRSCTTRNPPRSSACDARGNAAPGGQHHGSRPITHRHLDPADGGPAGRDVEEDDRVGHGAKGAGRRRGGGGGEGPGGGQRGREGNLAQQGRPPPRPPRPAARRRTCLRTCLRTCP